MSVLEQFGRVGGDGEVRGGGLAGGRIGVEAEHVVPALGEGERGGAADEAEARRPRCASEVEPRVVVVDAFGGDGVDVALAQEDEGAALDLDLGFVLGVEQDAVAA